MKVFHWLFLLIVLFAFVLLAILLSDVLPGSSGMLHPEFKTMLKGGPSIAASARGRWLALFFGIGIILFFVTGIFIGLASRNKLVRDQARKPLLIGAVAYLLVFISLTLSYWSYHDTGSSIYLGGFPLPTGILLYGVTLLPVVFTILYVRNFGTWVLTGEELERFHEINRKRKARLGNTEDYSS